MIALDIELFPRGEAAGRSVLARIEIENLDRRASNQCRYRALAIFPDGFRRDATFTHRPDDGPIKLLALAADALT